MTIAIYPTDPDLLTPAKNLSSELNLPIIETDNFHYHYWLLLTKQGLSLKKAGDKIKPIQVEFLTPELQYRVKQASAKNEALVRALGIKKNDPRLLVDGTGGLGVDSYLLTAFGIKIIMIERSPVIYALLKDGITRAHLESQIQLVHANTIDWLKSNHPPELIYLDPMFPVKNKSALAKREMQIFQGLIGEDKDTETLLKAALACATQRVVVKRSRYAPTIAGTTQPSFDIKGKSCRFDVYLK